MASAGTSRSLGRPLRQKASLLSPEARYVSKRQQHDLSIRRATGRPILASGPGGRSSTTGSVATVFGCTGFLGRYLVSKLARQGAQVVVPYRDEDEKRHLKVMGDLGQVVPLEWTLRNDTQIEECVRSSDIVYNLVGRNYETKNYSFNDVHVEGARRIARIAYQSGVSRFVHVSHINADAESASYVYRAKAAGENAVADAFPGATIARPAILFGHEDRFLNSIAAYPFSWRLNGQETRMRPVAALDVAEALKVIGLAESTIGKTFSLAGPKEYTIEQIIAICEANTVKKLQGFNVPKAALSLIARLYQNVWWPTLSPDEVTRRCIDDKPDAPGTLSWSYLGLEPASLEEQAIVYLRRHRSSAYYDRPGVTGGIRLRQPQYNVIE